VGWSITTEKNEGTASLHYVCHEDLDCVSKLQALKVGTLTGAGDSLLYNIHHNKYKIFKVKHELPDSLFRDKRDRRWYSSDKSVVNCTNNRLFFFSGYLNRVGAKEVTFKM